MVFSALSVAGSDSGGGAGVQADLKTFAAHRVHGLSVITSLTAQNTSSVKAVFDIPDAFIEAQFDAVHEDFQIGAAKTGMLSTRDIIHTVVKALGDYKLVVDPVMVSESGVRLLGEGAVETLKNELLPRATVTTPNVYEAEILSGMKIRGLGEMRAAAEKISQLGCNVVIKGGHLKATDLLYVDKRFYTFAGDKLIGGFHGSGCTFSAAVTANLSKGFDLVASVSMAKEFIKGALKTAYPPGRGNVLVSNQMRTAFQVGHDNILFALEQAVVELEEVKNLFRFIPEVGVNLCYGKEGAVSLEDVAGVTGRIIRVLESVRAVGMVEYGASKHVARVVLAAMNHDASMRAAVNIRYLPEIVEAVEENGCISVSSFDRDDEPENTSTMEWGTNNAIERMGRVPDVVYDCGGLGKESMIRILGKNPSDVIMKLKKIIGVVGERGL